MPKRKTPYRSKVKIGVDAEGKPINKWIQGRTREELRRARQQVIAVYITGEALGPDRLFGDYASEWYRVKKQPFVSASTRESYRTALNKDLLPILGDRNLRAITSMELQEILNRYADRSATKITVIQSAIRSIFKSALADRLISTDPTLSLVRPAASKAAEKITLTPDQRADMETVCREHPSGHYLALMYYLGVRPGEARGLRWEDIDWQRSQIRVERDIDYKDGAAAGDLKTQKSRRVVPMPAPLRAILTPIRGLPGTYIAHGERGAHRPLSKSSAERMWVELMDAVGLTVPAPEKNRYAVTDIRHTRAATITPHALRHNYITMCWEHGLDPYETMKLVGHTNITTTMNIYTHLSSQKKEKAILALQQHFSDTIPDAL